MEIAAVNDCRHARRNFQFPNLLKKVGGRRFGRFRNKQNTTDPKLGFTRLNCVYSLMQPNIKAYKVS